MRGVSGVLALPTGVCWANEHPLSLPTFDAKGFEGLEKARGVLTTR